MNILSPYHARRTTFKDKYRRFDMLMIDDIQFLAGKEGLKKAFFHTFNHYTNQIRNCHTCDGRQNRFRLWIVA